MSVTPECKSESANEVEIELLDVDVLKRCGILVFNLFEQLKSDKLLGNDSSCSSLSTSNSTCSAGDTYMELTMIKAFDQLYDLMSHDLEKADGSYMVPPKLQLYDDLNDFMRHEKLRQINRYVFGNGPISDDWEAKTTSDLETVRTWQGQFEVKTSAPNRLIEVYRQAADDQKLWPKDVAMVAFAALGFLLGYDAAADYEYMPVCWNMEVFYEPGTFRRVYNAVTRRVRMQLDADDDASKNLVDYFDGVLTENPDVVAACNWLYGLLAGRPEAVEQITRTDIFTGADPDGPCNGAPGDDSGTDMRTTPSYYVQLRVFYSWLSEVIYLWLSDGYGYNRSTWLNDDFVSCLSEMHDYNLLFNDVYDGMLRHFTKFLNDYNCPASTMEIFRVTCDDEMFKSIIRFFINSYLNYCYSSDNLLSSNQIFSDSSELE